MRIAIYSRKSKWTGKGESIENQLTMCHEYINVMIPNAHTAQIDEYEDEGFSGKNTKRPQFQKMMKDIRQSHYDYLVCYKLDRLGRNIADLALLIDEMNQLDITFISIKERFDTSTTIGKAMLYFSGVLAQMEREQIAERVRDNMLLLARTGRWLGGITPIGFESCKEEVNLNTGKKRISYRLKINPMEIEVVKFIYHSFLKERSLTRLERRLKENNIKTRQHNLYKITTIRDILTNPVYCVADEVSYDYFVSLGCQVCAESEELIGKYGFISYNKTSSMKYKNHDNPPEEWIIAVGRHEGMIDSSEFIDVQKLLEQNKKKGEHFRKVQNQVTRLSGLIYCKCGAPMRPKNLPMDCHYHNGERRFTYICSQKEKSHKTLCDVNNLNGNMIDEMVEQTILQWIQQTNQNYINQFERKVLNGKHKTISEAELLEQELLEKKKKIHLLIEKLGSEDIDSCTLEYISEQVNRLDRECQSLNDKLKEISSHEKYYKENGQVDEIIEMVHDCTVQYEKFTVTEKRLFLRIIIDKVIWDGNDIQVYLKDSC